MSEQPQWAQQIAGIRAGYDDRVRALSDEHVLRAFKAEYLGKPGLVSDLLKEMTKVPPAERRAFGSAANDLKQFIEDDIARRLAALDDARAAQDLARVVDVTLPARPVGDGHLHLMTQCRLEVLQIFAEIGFTVADGPQIETDWHNFEALAIPKDHPARDMQDSFWISEELVLRTHTSPVQVRTMLTQKPPIRIIAPGFAFRRDDDLTHSPMFTQVEGLAVAEGLAFSDLKGVLLHFVKRFFAQDLAIRLRPSYFQFTEPSAEVDMQCRFCMGSGCRVVQGHRLARDRRQRDGRSGSVSPRPHRQREVHRVRVRHGPRAHGDASPRRQGHQVLLRGRRALPGAVLMPGASMRRIRRRRFVVHGGRR